MISGSHYNSNAMTDELQVPLTPESPQKLLPGSPGYSYPPVPDMSSVPESHGYDSFPRRRQKRWPACFEYGVFQYWRLSFEILVAVILIIVAVSGYKDRIHDYYYGPTLAPCVSEACIGISASMQSSMNKTADPCHDFYNYACGGWEHSRVIPTEKLAISQFSELSDANMRKLKTIFERTCNEAGDVVERDNDDDDDDWTGAGGGAGEVEVEFIPCADQPDPRECLNYAGSCEDPLIGEAIKVKCPHLCCVPATQMVTKTATTNTRTTTTTTATSSSSSSSCFDAFTLSTQKFYDACLHEKRNDAFAFQSFKKKVLPKIALVFPSPPPPPPADNAAASDGRGSANMGGSGGTAWKKTKLSKTLAYLHKIDVDVLFYVYPGADDLEPQTKSLFMGQSGLSLPDPSYYNVDPTASAEEKIAREQDVGAFRTYVFTAFQLLGYSDAEAFATAVNVLKFESQMAALFTPKDELRDPIKNYNKMNLYELSAGMALDWPVYFKELGVPDAATDDRWKSMLVAASPSYFHDLGEFLSSTDSETLTAYFQWKAVLRFGTTLGEDFADAWLDFAKSLYGVEALPPRWKYCVAQTTNHLTFIVGRLFAEAILPAEDRKEANTMVSNIRQSFESSLPKLSWIDKQTSKVAVDKAAAIVQKIGYPEWIFDDDVLYDHYLGQAIGEVHFENILSASLSGSTRVMNKFYDPVDRTEWYMGPSEVNAYYAPKKNEIVFPAGILQPPFFSSGVGRFFNYGSIGSVIAHELTHGFDDQGRMYDKIGVMKPGGWMSPKASEAFQENAQCFVDQYSQFRVNGEDVNGKLTVGENIADNGGLARAYKAYKTSGPAEPPLPGLGLTNDQVFFVSFAQAWCGKTRPQQARMALLTDVHAPRGFRVKGSLQNFQAFSDAFKCPAKSTMNPTEKCTLW